MIGRKPKVGARGTRIFRIGGKCSGLELDQVIEPHRHAMHRADESVAPAAHHPDPEPPAEALNGGCVNHDA